MMQFYWKVKAVRPWQDRELTRRKELKLTLESQHIVSPHKTIAGEYTLKLLTYNECYWSAVWPAKLWYVCKDVVSLIIKTLNSHDKSEELKFMEKLYKDDVNISMLTAQMEILQVLLKDGDYLCFDEIIAEIKELPNPEREMIKEVSWFS